VEQVSAAREWEAPESAGRASVGPGWGERAGVAQAEAAREGGAAVRESVEQVSAAREWEAPESVVRASVVPELEEPELVAQV
jgi:hypothetical protein